VRASLPLRVVSLVPSWTETLLECGAEVVGRTRFCIHPKEQTRGIAVLGGTKDLSRERLAAIDPAPSLIILDKDENPREFTSEMPLRWLATHIRRIEDVAPALKEMAAVFTEYNDQSVAGNLLTLAARWEKVAQTPNKVSPWQGLATPEFPGLIEWLIAPAAAAREKPRPETRPETRPNMRPSVVYVIWKNPWMAITVDTFIGSVLLKTGWSRDDLWPSQSAQLYPVFEKTDLPAHAILLLSTEPYPFASSKVRAEVMSEFAGSGHALALIDGESLSWFGSRSLRFLESALL
jgi:hypothetical protein